MLKFVLSFFILCVTSFQLYSQNIRDYAQFFSVENSSKVQSKIEYLEKKIGVENLVIIETFAEIPSGTSLRNFYKKKFPRGKSFKGVYILITKKPKKIIFGSSKSLRGKLRKEALNESRNLFLSHFKKKEFDQGLEQGVNYLSSELTLAFNKKSEPKKELAHSQTKVKPKEASSGFSFSRLVIWGAIILCLLFLVGRLLSGRRGHNQFDRGQNKPGEQWNGNQGGGPGIFGSILGGIGGAMAGNWLYDKFFGSNTSAASAPPTTEPQSAAPIHEQSNQDFSSEPDIGDISGDFSSGDDWGGDFGDSGGDDW